MTFEQSHVELKGTMPRYLEGEVSAGDLKHARALAVTQAGFIKEDDLPEAVCQLVLAELVR